jgi:hypothetical protein
MSTRGRDSREGKIDSNGGDGHLADATSPLATAARQRRLVQRRRGQGGDARDVAPGAEAELERADAQTGAPLPDGLKQKFEGSLGADLSAVRVHTGAPSAQAAKAVGAQAYTTGRDIHFAEGKYDPASRGGQELLAHEVAHTAQQERGGAHAQAKLEVSAGGDASEREADGAAAAMIVGRPAPVSAAAPGIHRKEDKDDHDKEKKEGGAGFPGRPSEEAIAMFEGACPSSAPFFAAHYKHDAGDVPHSLSKITGSFYGFTQDVHAARELQLKVQAIKTKSDPKELQAITKAIGQDEGLQKDQADTQTAHATLLTSRNALQQMFNHVAYLGEHVNSVNLQIKAFDLGDQIAGIQQEMDELDADAKQIGDIVGKIATYASYFALGDPTGGAMLEGGILHADKIGDPQGLGEQMAGDLVPSLVTSVYKLFTNYDEKMDELKTRLAAAKQEQRAATIGSMQTELEATTALLGQEQSLLPDHWRAYNEAQKALVGEQRSLQRRVDKKTPGQHTFADINADLATLDQVSTQWDALMKKSPGMREHAAAVLLDSASLQEAVAGRQSEGGFAGAVTDAKLASQLDGAWPKLQAELKAFISGGWMFKGLGVVNQGIGEVAKGFDSTTRKGIEARRKHVMTRLAEANTTAGGMDMSVPAMPTPPQKPAPAEPDPYVQSILDAANLGVVLSTGGL